MGRARAVRAVCVGAGAGGMSSARQSRSRSGWEEEVRVQVSGWKPEVFEIPLFGIVRVECRISAGQIKGKRKYV